MTSMKYNALDWITSSLYRVEAPRDLRKYTCIVIDVGKVTSGFYISWDLLGWVPDHM